MIRTVKARRSRRYTTLTAPADGCSPGGNCCSECAGHANLGDVSCDQDGNCYDSSSGVYTPAAVTASITSSLGTFNPNLILVMAGIGAILLYIEAGSGTARKRR
jgi:hypothetical protein